MPRAVFDLEVDRSQVAFDNSEWSASRWVDKDELGKLAIQTEDLCPDTAAFIRRYLNVQATIEDSVVIAEIIIEIEQYYGSTEIDPLSVSIPRVERYAFGDHPSAHVVLARFGDQVAGIATYSFLWPANGTKQSMFLKEIYVRPAYRQQGVARQLMDRLREIAKDNECDRIDWTADRANAAAIGFYASLGVPASDSKLFYRMPMKNE